MIERTDYDLERELVHWEHWMGVTGVHYARRMKSSPPVVFRSDNLEGLHQQIKDYLRTGEPPWNHRRGR